MTIRELYEWAASVGAEDKPLKIYGGDADSDPNGDGEDFDLEDVADYSDEVVIY